jgi:hypothetical protein
VSLPLVLLLLTAGVVPAEPATPNSDERVLAEARAFMAAMGPESRSDAARVDRAYRQTTPLAPFADRAALLAAVARGSIARLPADAWRFNVRPRLHGLHPIGQMDLPYQPAYVSAHPAALGLLLHVAARVGAPLDVTSLVRHAGYQDSLQRTNVNARTVRSMHTVGLAFDLSILHRPLAEAVRLRDVLRAMRADGSLYFIAETRQLVFHVVPTPRRLEFYAATFEALTSIPPPRDPGRRPLPAPVLAAALAASGSAIGGATGASNTYPAESIE